MNASVGYTPLIFSLITPFFNRAKSLSRCIRSVLSQSYEHYEHIVVNDGSSDSSREMVKEYQKECGRLILVDLPSNKGVNFARNRGVDNARGDYIVFLDSDEYLVENALSDLYRIMQEHGTYKHFLFTPSDRAQEFREEKKPVYYTDWLKLRFQGDFTHVVERKIVGASPFFEGFRAYENLNWFRIFRITEPQLFVNKVFVNRGMVKVGKERSDSASSEYDLTSKSKINNRIRANELLIEMYGEDLVLHNKRYLRRLIIHNTILSMSIGKHCQTDKYLATLKKQGKIAYILLRPLNAKIFSPFIYWLLQVRHVVKIIKWQF